LCSTYILRTYAAAARPLHIPAVEYPESVQSQCHSGPSVTILRGALIVTTCLLQAFQRFQYLAL